MYKWSNKNRLKDLHVSSGKNILNFRYKNELVIVYLSNESISRVVHKIGKETTKLDKPYKLSKGLGNTDRNVYHYLKPNGPSPELRLGITHHTAKGNWSSTPHPFELNPVKGFEEVFFYLIDGRAIQIGRGLWQDNKKADEIWKAKDHTWATVPMGYHPIVGEPDSTVSYVWCYICKKKGWEKV